MEPNSTLPTSSTNVLTTSHADVPFRFLDLPLEIRNMVYQAYLESNVKEHAVKPCHLQAKGMACHCEVVSKRFWVPFGVHAPVDHDSGVESKAFQEPSPALWKVCSSIRKEAIQLYYTTKLCVDYRLEGKFAHHTAGYRDWSRFRMTLSLPFIRRLHVDVPFRIEDTSSVNGTISEETRQHAQALCGHPDAPLFRLELLRDCEELRVLALGPLVDEQERTVVQKTTAGLARMYAGKVKFDGFDLLISAHQLTLPNYDGNGSRSKYLILKENPTVKKFLRQPTHAEPNPDYGNWDWYPEYKHVIARFSAETRQLID
jgi:hypothetical protein